MVSYDIEHNVPKPSQPSPSSRQRPDLSTFYSSLSQVDTSSVRNPNAEPTPVDVAASFRLLGEAMQSLMAHNSNTDLVEQLTSQLHTLMEAPPKKPRGCPPEFIEGLERAGKKELKGKECAICGEEFLSDEYPLVVRLPCNEMHMFDLDCIQPWLKLNSTCPLDRKDLLAKKKPPTPPPEDEEEEFDDMYG